MKILANRWVLFVFILLIAGVFRVLLMQYVEFKGDEALNLLLASRFLFHHPFPPASQASSAGILNFPLLNYLLFPIIIFTLYPPTVSLVIAIINILTVGGFFLLFSKYHNKLTGFIAGSLIALSPWAILYSRKIWAQDFVLPLSLPFFFSVYKILEGKRRYWVFFGISSLLLIQIHQIAGIIPLLVFFALYKRALASWKLLLLGIIIGIIPTIPYFWYILPHICIPCQNTNLTDRLSFHSLASFIRPLQILSIGNFYTEFGSDYALFADKFHIFYVLSKLTYISYLLIPLGELFFWLKSNHVRFFVLVCIAYILLLFAAGIESLMHYYILLIPPFSLFIGFFLSSLIHTKKFLFFGLGVLCIYLIGLISIDTGFLLFLGQRGGLGGEYGSGYINSEKSLQEKLIPFHSLSNYLEIELMYFSPLQYFHGYMPLGKMLFPYSDLMKDEPTREKQFLASPDNPILQRQVFAYYTQNPNPTWQEVVKLKEKERTNNLFDFIYQRVLSDYLSAHYKNIYETPDFLLLYPRHWSKKDTDKGIMLGDGQVELTVSRITLPTDMLPIQSCFKEGLWCGYTYQPILLRATQYQFSIMPMSKDPKTNAALKKYSETIFKEITDSITVLQ